MPGHLTARVEGLRELNAALRELDRKLPRNVTRANKQVAEFLAAKAQARAEGLGGVAAKSAPSIKARATQASASLSIGSDRYPFALGSEFGSVQYRQFPPWKGSGPGAGYVVYETIRQEGPAVHELYEQALTDVLREAFPG